MGGIDHLYNLKFCLKRKQNVLKLKLNAVSICVCFSYDFHLRQVLYVSFFNSLMVVCLICSSSMQSDNVIQLTLVISTSLISNNRLSRSENLVPAYT